MIFFVIDIDRVSPSFVVAGERGKARDRERAGGGKIDKDRE